MHEVRGIIIHIYIYIFPKQCLHCGVLAVCLLRRYILCKVGSRFAAALKCCKKHAIVTPRFTTLMQTGPYFYLHVFYRAKCTSQAQIAPCLRHYLAFKLAAAF